MEEEGTEEKVEEKVEEVVIPEIQLEENKIILPTKEIPLVINGKEEMITFQKLTAGQRRDLARKHLSTKLVGRQMQGSLDTTSFQIGLIAKVIIKAPFPLGEETIASFPDGVLDYLNKQYDDWTGDSKKKVN